MLDDKRFLMPDDKSSGVADDDDVLNMMSEEDINDAFGDIIQTTQILLAKGCNCSKSWDYC